MAAREVEVILRFGEDQALCIGYEFRAQLLGLQDQKVARCSKNLVKEPRFRGQIYFEYDRLVILVLGAHDTGPGDEGQVGLVASHQRPDT